MLTDYPLSYNMFETLLCAVPRMTPEAWMLMREYVLSKEHPAGGFMNRAGKPDLYYTMFGMTLAAALDVPMNVRQTQRFLNLVKLEELKLTDFLAYVRSRMFADFLSIDESPRDFRRLFQYQSPPEVITAYQKLIEKHEPARFPFHNEYSPYSQFIQMMLAQDLNQFYIPLNFEQYQCPNGLFSNWTDESRSSTTATAAILAILRYYEGLIPQRESIVYYFAQCQNFDGGFKATHDSHGSDLISTATALWTLSFYNQFTEHSSTDFISRTFMPNGGFSSGSWDRNTDLKCSMYGLLALGVIPPSEISNSNLQAHDPSSETEQPSADTY